MLMKVWMVGCMPVVYDSRRYEGQARSRAMPMTNADAVSRALDMISAIDTLSDGLAQYNAAQARYYTASLYELGLLDETQFNELMAQSVKALHDWETHHASMNADGLLND
jgi:hypothetical protein